MTTSFTRYFRFGIPDFLSVPWHTDWDTLVRDIDRVLYGILLSSGISIWKNNTVYAENVLIADATTGQIWQCEVMHVSAASPTTFAQDRAAHPTYWNTFSFTEANLDYEIITTDAAVVSATQRFLIFDKAVPSASTITLPPVANRGGISLLVIDWAGNAGDIVFTPYGTETIMGKTVPDNTWSVSSSGGAGLGGKIELIPIETLNGWVVKIG